MVSTATPFSDIQNHWARLFITALAQRGIVSGLPNGTYRPDNSLTRAEFAAIIAKAFPTVSKKRQYVPFVDVPTNYWAAAAIQTAYEKAFISGFPDKSFRSANRITRVEVLVSLVAGLEIATKVKPDLLSQLPQIYQDSVQIPGYGRNQVAIATSAGLVVSSPNVKLLNPNLAATRADVAVIIYQALVYLGEAEKIASSYLVQPPLPTPTPTPTPTPIPIPTPTPTPVGSVKVNHSREFRGAWVASVWYSNWPSKAGLSVAQQKAELSEIISKLQALNFNALIFQVRPEGDALYESQLEPWSAWITGTQGKVPEPFYDPLAFAIAECHKRNIELHAWFNPYRASTSTDPAKTVRPHIAATNPESVYLWKTQRWMDPGLKIVQDRAYNVILDVVKRYDVDGIHLDDYFYPYPIEGQPFPDDKTYAAYKAAGGTLSLGDWRRDNVNRMVQRLWQGIKATKPDVKFGISPFGIYRPGQPTGITGLDAYNVLYADAKKWLEEGWIDYIAPQLYWRTDQPQQSYSALLQWWTQVNTKQRHVYAGNNLTEPSNKSRESDEIEKQVKISRSQAGRLSLGNIFFNVGVLTENSQGIADKFQSLLYNKPALPPTLSWQDKTPPPPPIGLQVNNRKLSWQPGDNQPVRSWTLYRLSGDTWTIQRILSAGTTFATVQQAGTYAVCAVDRLANESVGTVITVS
ncbi:MULTISPECIES: glycoside hydrolase family 10 protein [Nostoc]|uniref:Family 10 glycosylhydrolase n=2 Tax=Nostoc TaxID=1177 RepID=A0ABR8IF81_9NOSO|nr:MULTISPECIES: family 10 glycosylhydrolase [Nostoc]MBD2564211.1 family 10 glycosylhydrolase [Nostoc linckia FACHB-391]MBD2650236.1 family 10 glycosylhydrolase [Nostoc foliaceum FACHB-393]